MSRNNPVKITKGTTAIWVECTNNGYFLAAPSVSAHPWLARTVTEWVYDHRYSKYVVHHKYYRYDKSRNVLQLPVFILKFLTDYLDQNCVDYVVEEIPSYPAQPMAAQYIGNLEDREYQTKAIDYLTSPVPMKALSLKTGRGKSSIAVRAALDLGLRTLIILPASLVDQWVGVYESLSTAKVGVLRGSKSVAAIVESGYQTEFDVILASINTIQEYAVGSSHYQELPPLDQFIKLLGIGVKIVDECHINFHANAMIDIQSNVRHNIYLSATHMRSAKSSDRIFQRVYPDSIRYEDEHVAGYVNITQLNYSVGEIHEKFYNTPRGYSTFKYEKYLMRHLSRLQVFLERFWAPTVYECYYKLRAPGQKLLVIVGLTEFGMLLVNWFRETYPTLKVSEYFNSTEESVLEEMDVIVSTVGSCGTGKDVSGLRSMFVLTSIGSDTLNLQTLGRLRKLPNDTPEFVYFTNTAIGAQVRHAASRRELYKSEAKQFRVVSL